MHQRSRQPWRRLVVAGLALALVGGIQLAGGLPATATGTAYKNCTQGLSVTGKSSQALGGQTASPTSPNPKLGCGQARVQVRYRVYPGSPTYSSPWQAAAGIVTHHPGGTVVGASHDCGYKAWGFSGGWPFTT
ncbi:hypothetical protein NVV95_08420 [Herbiconiux sp. CPCC 205716]|uniref:Secreted protein n=1 Tax=Herbiconiux gentiana TaxID=2970912 RepID=A0ABT2GEP3_9MICO|nr:hypothetical protein [Herbiconiux gentiana]MCS5714576.1 hypothetical protein [Herbiconiux gentiana]